MKKSTLAIVLIALVIAACAPTPTTGDKSPLNVSVSILPEKYFVERIGAEFVNVNVMVGPGDSPHTYEPKADQMRALSEANVYFAIGVEFEDAWMNRIASANPEMHIVDLSEGLDKIPMTAPHHNEEKNHEQGELDPHVWTSPEMVAQMAAVIFTELAAGDPDHQQIYQENLDAFLADIETLQTDIERTVSNLDNRKFMVFHPSWGYFAREFDLEQIPIEVEGSEPSPSELADLIREATQEDIYVIFAQPEFSTQTAEYIAGEIGGEVVLISPLAENWLENMQEVVRKLESAL